jgi:hypothetical protein
MFVVPEWIERHCSIPDGFRKGQPFKLYGYQLLYLANFYLVRGEVEFDPAQPILGPAFVYSRGILVGPQKVGKGPHTAAHICAEGVGPALFAGWAGKDDGYACFDHGCGCGWEYPYERGEPMGMQWPTPLIQITAFSEEQTENIYDALRPMIEEGPLSDIIPKTGEEFIRIPGGGRIDTVTSSNQSRLGQRTTFIGQDEVGIWTVLNKMMKVADTQYRNLAGMGGRASLTTNAWNPAERSVAQIEYGSKAKDIYRQFVHPPKTLQYETKKDRRRIHRVVYPADTLRQNGGHVDLDSIEGEAVKLIAKDLPQAMRFFGNIVVAGHGAAVDPARWKELAKPRTVPEGAYIGLGFDGSISEDATVLRACTDDGYSFLLGAWVRPPGPKGRHWRVPRSKVHDAVRDAFTRYRVGLMLCDPPKWDSEIEGWQDEFGEKVVLFFPTNWDKRMGPAVDRWLTMIAEGSHTHDDDPITNDHVVNAQKRKARAKDPEDDGRTLYTLTKGPEGGKIDAAVADVLATLAATTMPKLKPSPAPVSVSGGDVAVIPRGGRRGGLDI